MMSRHSRDTSSKLEMLFVACLILSLECSGVEAVDSAPAHAKVRTASADAAAESKPKAPIKLPLDATGATVAIDGKDVKRSGGDHVVWKIPSEAELTVAFPYKGDPPKRVVMQLVWPSPKGEIEIGSVGTDPKVRDGVVSYSVRLPVLSMERGRVTCLIRSRLGDGDSSLLLHEGRLGIDFAKAAPQK